MLLYIAKRLASLVPVLLGVTIVIFVLVRNIPGDPADAFLPLGAPPEAREAFRQQYQLDEPIPVQYGAWLRNALDGDLGMSIQRREPAISVTVTALVNTLQLAVASGAIALLGGVTLGVWMGWRPEGLGSRLANKAVISFASVPQFWLGLIFLWVFALTLGWFPTGGMGPRGNLIGRLEYMVMPSVTVALLPLAVISRLTRALVLELREQDFVVTLRTRQYSGVRIMRHLARNAAPGIVNIAGLQLGYVVLGTLFAEVVFSWPGIGTAVVSGIASRDYPVIQAVILVTGLLFASLTTVVDVLMRALDPRSVSAA